MNPLVESLGPVFIVSFALQQLIELLDPILDKVIKPHKEWILSAVALVVGLLLTLGLGLRILRPFGVTSMPWLDIILTALFVTGGTKWLNDLLKIIAYKKQEVQARAMMATQQALPEAATRIVRASLRSIRASGGKLFNGRYSTLLWNG